MCKYHKPIAAVQDPVLFLGRSAFTRKKRRVIASPITWSFERVWDLHTRSGVAVCGGKVVARYQLSQQLATEDNYRSPEGRTEHGRGVRMNVSVVVFRQAENRWHRRRNRISYNMSDMDQFASCTERKHR